MDFESQLKELELMQNELIKENSGLKEEVEVLRKSTDVHEISSFSEDIHRISRQVHTLLSVLQNLKEGKDISLLFLLDLGDARYISSSRQLALDIAQLKKDINEIKQIASDYHAEILGGSICSNQ